MVYVSGVILVEIDMHNLVNSVDILRYTTFDYYLIVLLICS